MPTINQRLQILQLHAPEALRAQSLTQALKYAEDDEINPIAESLLKTPSVNGYEALLQKYYCINTKIKQKISLLTPKYSIALARTARSPSPEQRLIALQLIETREDTNSIAAVEEQFTIQSNTPEIIEIAARILLQITRKLSHPGPKSKTTPILLQQLDRAVATAIDHYPAHRRPEILLAAALLAPHPGPALTNFLNDHDHPAHFALRGVIKKFDDNLIADSALPWLTLNQLAPQLIDRIARLARTEHLTAILNSIHLTLHPTVRNRLQRLDTRFPCTITPEKSPLTPTQQLQLIRWLNTIPLKKTDRILHLTSALSFTNPTARLAALRALINLNTPEANAALESFTFDENENIARIATRHLIRTTNPETQNLLTQLTHSPHPTIRRLAQNHLTPDNLNTLFSTFAALTQPDISTTAARTELQLTRLSLAFRNTLHNNKPALIQLLRNKLLTADRKTALPAIQLINRLNLTCETELELLAVAAENNPHITSAVMTPLGSLQSDASRESLYAGLQHSNSRVRANALDSLRKRNQTLPKTHHPHPDWQPIVKQNTISDDNRLRANAIRALADLDPDDSDHQLKIMLKDPRPMHRISALWLAGKQSSLNCAVEVATLAKNETLKPVRNRARRSAARLLGKLTSRKIPPYTPNENQPTITTTKNTYTTTSKQTPRKHIPQLTPLIILCFTITQLAARCFAQSTPTTNNQTGKITESFTRAFTSHQNTARDWTALWWISGTLTLAVTLAFLIKLRKNDRKTSGPTVRTIARNLGLSPLQTLLLNHLARKTKLQNALPLIISRGSFNHYTTTYLKTKSLTTRTLRKPIQSILNKTKTQLFTQ